MRLHNRFDDPHDPAMEPVYEAGGGEAEGFEMAEQELIEHASHGDWGGTARITEHAEGFEEETEPDPEVYGEADGELPHEARDQERGEQADR